MPPNRDPNSIRMNSSDAPQDNRCPSPSLQDHARNASPSVGSGDRPDTHTANLSINLGGKPCSTSTTQAPITQDPTQFSRRSYPPMSPYTSASVDSSTGDNNSTTRSLPMIKQDPLPHTYPPPMSLFGQSRISPLYPETYQEYVKNLVVPYKENIIHTLHVLDIPSKFGEQVDALRQFGVLRKKGPNDFLDIGALDYDFDDEMEYDSEDEDMVVVSKQFEMQELETSGRTADTDAYVVL
jgi:hypothetical protein